MALCIGRPWPGVKEGGGREGGVPVQAHGAGWSFTCRPPTDTITAVVVILSLAVFAMIAVMKTRLLSAADARKDERTQQEEDRITGVTRLRPLPESGESGADAGYLDATRRSSLGSVGPANGSLPISAALERTSAEGREFWFKSGPGEMAHEGDLVITMDALAGAAVSTVDSGGFDKTAMSMAVEEDF